MCKYIIYITYMSVHFWHEIYQSMIFGMYFLTWCHLKYIICFNKIIWALPMCPTSDWLVGCRHPRLWTLCKQRSSICRWQNHSAVSKHWTTLLQLLDYFLGPTVASFTVLITRNFFLYLLAWLELPISYWPQMMNTGWMDTALVLLEDKVLVFYHWI